MEKCKIAQNGIHEYTTSTTAGEVCKYCGVPRDNKVPPISQTGAVPSPYYDPETEVCEDCGLPRADHEHEEREDLIMSNAVDPMKDYQIHAVSDETYQAILRDTKSKSAIVITFADNMDNKEGILMTKGFHLNSVKVAPQAVVALLLFVVDALRGRLGGRGFKKIIKK